MRTLTTFSLMLALSVPAFATAQASDPDGGAGPACACDGHGPGGRHRGPPDPAHMQAFFTQRLESMTRELSLRPAQVQQIQAIFDAAMGRAQAMRARRGTTAGRPGPEQRRRHMRARFEVEERVAAVLDREQLLRWLSMRHQHMLEGRGHGPGHGRRGPGQGRRAGQGR